MRVRLHHVHIFSSDIEATIRFWQDMFGAQVQFDMEAAGARVLVIAIGSGRINIYDQPPRSGKGGAFHHLGIQTDDLDAVVAHMKNKGFQFKGAIREYGYLRYIMAMAPDNLLLEIFQIIPERASQEKQQSLKRAFAFD